MSVGPHVEWIYGHARPLGEKSRYFNLGYWREKPATLDEACEALAALAGEAAGLGPEDIVLDAGCGYADQDVFWARRFKPRRIVGLNIAAGQVAQARRRIERLGLADRIEIRRASATAIPFAAASFDKVVAVESALHFDSRRDFFEEAWRVLRGGGRLVTTDLVPLADRQCGFAERLSQTVGTLVWGIPWANLYPRRGYAALLRAVGFEDVVVTSIREYVFAPFHRHLARYLRSPGTLSRLDPLFSAYWLASAATGGVQFKGWDYVLAMARKPASENRSPTVDRRNARRSRQPAAFQRGLWSGPDDLSGAPSLFVSSRHRSRLPPVSEHGPAVPPSTSATWMGCRRESACSGQRSASQGCCSQAGTLSDWCKGEVVSDLASTAGGALQYKPRSHRDPDQERRRPCR